MTTADKSLFSSGAVFNLLAAGLSKNLHTLSAIGRIGLSLPRHHKSPRFCSCPCSELLALSAKSKANSEVSKWARRNKKSDQLLGKRKYFWPPGCCPLACLVWLQEALRRAATVFRDAVSLLLDHPGFDKE